MTITTEPIQKPETDWRDEDYYAALRWVNEVRVTRFGLEPLDDLPCGVRGEPSQCVLAHSLPNVRYASALQVQVPGMTICVPLGIGGFVRRFDLGDYPALEN